MSTLPPAESGPVSVGMIGLGNMGLPMALNLLRASGPDRHIRKVTVTGRSRERSAALLAAGAAWAGTPRELAEQSDVLILMVPDLPQVEEVLFGPDGVAEASTELVVVVSATVSSAGLRTVDARLRHGTHERMVLVDAPVSGGTEGAEAGTLSIMVGGDVEPVARVLPVLSACGSPLRLGPLGAGAVAKACNQLIVAATMSAIAEASVIAERSGLDLGALLDLLQGGYAGSRVLETKGRRLVERDYTPTGAAKFMVKDLSFAADAAADTRTVAPTLAAVRESFLRLTEAGLGDQDLAVIHRYVGSL
ncbi:NAD(P)-dependent oxidoreductase [Cryobacterium sp. 5B3]|uniref:NAD(P)-dependent oxidoreductase n=2 Tax=Cryobacterium TaxID=69578 RepID=UPI002AB4A967|nr:NAD(P)-dependent oxidoreductase [Cryobacterium sp. 5B3]MDY7542226.1 NAD(P)-dependent oxidoreductase [Cryobacterium sp. 5B3]MEB0265025.1 NAD(P)-dependent oxidoreductase [Cryobacterium sp. 10I5]MEB0275079.1 NAD(P)-dependent oxidoreductase [Cryobacterium sp. 5B3]